MARVPELGELIADRYRIQALAREGPGYLTLHAFDRDVEVEVSILWFRAGLFPTEEARREFLGDAVSIRGLAHPHLRRVYEAHVYQENAFATAQVGSAAAVVKRLGSHRPADELDVIRYATAIGEGLEAAHRLGQIHGYLVPSDVVEVSGQVKITGVGLYRAASRDVARDLFWTRKRYLAPEVVAGGEPTVRSDVFSMAAVLVEIASGVSSAEIAPALEAVRSAHPRVHDALSRALSSEPGLRHASVGAVLDQLRKQLVDDRVPTAKQPAMQEPLLSADTSQAIVIEAEEPPESVARRATTQRPRVTEQLLEDNFDPSPISLLNVDGDPMAEVTVPERPSRVTSPWSLETADISIDIDDPKLSVGDKTVEIDFHSKTREYRLEDSVPEDDSLDEPASEPILMLPPLAKPSMPKGDVPATLEPQIESKPLPRAASAEIMAPPDPFGGDGDSVDIEMESEVKLETSPRTLQAMPPPPSAAAPPSAPVVISKMPPRPVSPPTPIMPRLEQPGMQPVLKPISAGVPRPPQPQSLGHYAPPRHSDPPPAPTRPTRTRTAAWVWAAAAVVAVVLGGLLAVIFLRSGKDEKVALPDAAVAVASPVDAAPVVPDAHAGPCPKDMLHAEPEDSVAFCIDKFEATPAGVKIPHTEITLEEAGAACSARKARLCTSAEWIAACRGTDGASYPYGRRYVQDACNVSPGRKREIEAGGNYPECESAVGAFDMSGNVGEWTLEGFVQGGSARDYSGGRCSKRYRGRATKAYPDVGYRCCADPLAQP